MDEAGCLVGVKETQNIVKTADGAAVDGVSIDAKAHVSMNMWGLTLEFLEILEKGFVEFLDGIGENPLKAEYLLPIIIDQLIKEEKVSVQMLETKDMWFGVTYAEDKEAVAGSFRKLVEDGVYRSPLM